MPSLLPFLRVPIVLAPMAGAATPDLVAAVSNVGGLGSLPCAYLTPAEMRAQIAAVRERTSHPFAVNLFVETAPKPAEEQVTRAHERLRAFRNALGIPHPAQPPRPAAHYPQQIEAVLVARPAVFSFTFGIPSGDVLSAMRAAGIFTVGTATTVAEAAALERAGVDAVCAQGAEAGAHRGTFLAEVDESLIGTLALVPQVVDAVRLPVIATGGIGDGRGVAAVLALGAGAAQMGSAFLLADESAIPLPYRRALRGGDAHCTTLITAFSGRAARGLVNRFVREMDDPSLIAPYPYQNALTRDIRTASAQRNEPEYLSLWAGQAVSLATERPAAAIVEELLRDAARAADATRSALGMITP